MGRVPRRREPTSGLESLTCPLEVRTHALTTVLPWERIQRPTSHERVDDEECVELREGDSLRDLVPAALLVRRIVEKGGSRKFRRRVPKLLGNG
jgi:hypothetical protein